jgi:hypothetical protein
MLKTRKSYASKKKWTFFQLFDCDIVLIYAMALYLRNRFQQITKQFEGIWAKNMNSLQSLIREQNRVTLMVINLLLCISIYGKWSIHTSSYIRSITAMMGIFTSIGMYLLSYIPTQVSTEAHRCYNTINSINTRNKILLQTKLKIRL